MLGRYLTSKGEKLINKIGISHTLICHLSPYPLTSARLRFPAECDNTTKYSQPVLTAKYSRVRSHTRVIKVIIPITLINFPLLSSL